MISKVIEGVVLAEHVFVEFLLCLSVNLRSLNVTFMLKMFLGMSEELLAVNLFSQDTHLKFC